jgi:hypothetical protein
MQETRPTILYYGHHHRSMATRPIRHWCKFWGGWYVGFLCGFWVVFVVNGVLRLLRSGCCRVGTGSSKDRPEEPISVVFGFRRELQAKFTENRIADGLIKCIWKLYLLPRMKELTIGFSSQRESTLPRT